MEWQTIETAPNSGVILLAVEDSAGERRSYVAEISNEDDGQKWMVTVGWLGWSYLHAGWTPIGWMPLLPPPKEKPSVEG